MHFLAKKWLAAAKKRTYKLNETGDFKNMAKSKKTAKRSSGKYSFINVVHENLMDVAEVTRSGDVRIKRTDVKQALENAFEQGAKAAAGGERVRFPVIGALVRKDVAARKAGKGVNPFTGEPMTIKARPATKKPRWSFPKSLKETFAKKTNW